MQAPRFIALAAVALLLVPAGRAQEAETVPSPGETKPIVAQTLLRQLDDAFVQVFEKVAPSVVVIEAKKDTKSEDLSGLDFPFKNPRQRQFRMPDQQASEGSGFIIRADGYILTNSHVIADAAGLEVRMHDGRRFPAKVVGSDDKTDIAVLKIEAENLPVAELGDSAKVRVGQLVCAIGVPYSLDYSFTCGWVSAKGRSNLTNNTAYEDYIQTDAFINPGNSGGPLFDVDGRVIGMNTLINGIGRGLAFAIPSNMLREVGDQLIATGKVIRPWLGIRIETLGDNEQLAAQFPGIDKGVIVETIEMNAPAIRSDLRPADVITQVDGAPVTTARELQREILKKKVGDTVQLSVWRNGRSMKIPVPTGELPSEVIRAANAAPTPGASAPEPAAGDIQGMQVQAVDPALAENLKLGKAKGLVVTDVREDTPAADAGIQREDVITEVDQKEVGDVEAFRKQVAESQGERGVLLFIERKGRKTYAVLKPRE